MLNRCPLKTCHLPIPFGHLLCVQHWKLVPRPVREAVCHYQRAKPGGVSHRRAMRQAVQHVERQIEQLQREIEAKAITKPMPVTQFPYRDD